MDMFIVACLRVLYIYKQLLYIILDETAVDDLCGASGVTHESNQHTCITHIYITKDTQIHRKMHTHSAIQSDKV